MCKMDLSFWYSNCCESSKKLKDPFVKVESICLFVPIVDNFQYKKYSYLIFCCIDAMQCSNFAHSCITSLTTTIEQLITVII